MKLHVKSLGGTVPRYGRAGDAALDFYAHLEAPVVLPPGGRAQVGTGIAMAIPQGDFGLLAPRSGLGSRGLTLANTVGIIDSNYRGELLVNLINTGEDTLTVNPGDKFVQLVILPVTACEVALVDELDETTRGTDGFGSSGLS